MSARCNPAQQVRKPFLPQALSAKAAAVREPRPTLMVQQLPEAPLRLAVPRQALGIQPVLQEARPLLAPLANPTLPVLRLALAAQLRLEILLLRPAPRQPLGIQQVLVG
jgi:hypothetical protein